MRGQRNEVQAKELARQRPEGRVYVDRRWEMGQEVGRDQFMPRNPALIFWELRSDLHYREVP